MGIHPHADWRRVMGVHGVKTPCSIPPPFQGENVIVRNVSELQNLCCKTCDELKPHVVAAFERLKQQPDLIRSFFEHPQVGFY